MKLSKETLNVLKNFSNINPTLMFRKGNEIKTISTLKSIFSRAKLKETFPMDFGVYWLNDFINTIMLFDDPEMAFEKDHVKIKDKQKSVNFYYGSEESILFPDKDAERRINSARDGDIMVEFPFSKDMFLSIQKASNVLHLNKILLVCDKQKTEWVLCSENGITKNNFSLEVHPTQVNDEFKIEFTEEGLKMMPHSYNVTVRKPGPDIDEVDAITFFEKKAPVVSENSNEENSGEEETVLEYVVPNMNDSE